MCGLDGTAWTGGLALTKVEGAALVAGFEDPSGLRSRGIVVAGTKFMFIQQNAEMIIGKLGQGGITIFKTGQALIMGTYNYDMSPALSVKEVGKMADFLREEGY
jgi:hypothetical protein